VFTRIVDTVIVDSYTVWVTDNGTLGVSLLVDLCDLERVGEDDVEAMYRDFFKSLQKDVFCRIQFIRDYGRESSLAHSTRRDALKELGHVEHALIISLETHNTNFFSLLFNARKSAKQGKTSLEGLAQRLLRSFDLTAFRSLGVSFRSLNKDELESIFPPELLVLDVLKTKVGVDFGTTLTGVIRLWRPGSTFIGQGHLCGVLDSIGGTFEVRVLIRKKSAVFAEGFLRRSSKRAEGMEDRIGAKKYLEAQEALEKVALGGQDLLEYEYLIIYQRATEEELRRDGSEIVAKLRSVGDFYLETVGSLPSLISAYPGAGFHVSLFETDENIGAILPVSTQGRGAFEFSKASGALHLHRRDGSIDEVHVFDPSFENHSMCVFGTSGKGKSVFTNLLTDSLLNDPKNYIIKVDVGGSHSRQTEMARGQEFVFSIDRPSNMDPFRYLNGSKYQKESVQILSSFLEVLLIDDNEIRLSKSLKQEIEESILKYAQARGERCGFEDFVNWSRDLPRREFLKRWVKGGVFENAFKCVGEELPVSRLRYYNFSEIFQAQDPDFSQAGFSAVMALFNFEGLLSKDRRLVFICDETPFFIKRCFNFFHLSIANVRKLGHSFITICQKSSDVVIGGDTSILDNSHIKVLFSVDGDEASFKKRLKVDDDIIHRIGSLQSVSGLYSEALVLDRSGARTFVIRISSEELLRYSTKKTDLIKIAEARKIAPHLNLSEILRCLSLAGA
jgi:hypothetical protein